MEHTKTIRYEGEEREVKMSFGLVNLLAQLCGDIETASEISLNLDLQGDVLEALVVKRDKKGKPTEEFSLFAVESDADETGDLIAWAAEHVIDFFMSSMEKGAKTVEKAKPRLAALTSSPDGGAS